MIETVEDAKVYLDKILADMNNLSDVSIKAGMNTHAALWNFIACVFCWKAEEVALLIDVVANHINKRLADDNEKETSFPNPFDSLGENESPRQG